MAHFTMNWKDSLGQATLALSVCVLFTSVMDLFINRLMFRAGPEMLAHIDFPGISYVAVVGTISFTFEQMVLFLILGAAAAVLIRQSHALPRRLGLLLIPQLTSAGLLYFPLPLQVVWALSMVLILVTAVEVFGLLLLRSSRSGGITGCPLVGQRLFLVTLGLGFLFPIYYRVSVLVSSIGLASLPFGIQAYTVGIYAIIAAAVGAFVYALTTPSARFKLSWRTFALAALIPTLLVAPVLYGLMESFFMVQIFGLVIAMSTDIVLSFNMVRAVVLFSWFILAAVFLLWLKARPSRDGFLFQQGIGLVLILSMTFLFNYPSYLLLGTAGVFLLSFPLLRDQSQVSR